MISGLRGRVNRLGASRVFLEVSGVEYEVNVPLVTFEGLQRQSGGEDVFLFVAHIFTQDGQKLYGFLEADQRETFFALLDIQGVGATLAMSLLSHMDPGTLLRTCQTNDVKTLSRIPRVGKKTAENLIFHISRSREKWEKLLRSPSTPIATPLESAEDLALAALLQLGYRDNQVRSVIEKVRAEGKATEAADIIHAALRML